MPLYTYSRPSLQGRTLPVLIGLAIGDAMGATQEFERPENPVPYPALMTGPQVDIVGGGWLELAPGQVTDDTLMALALYRSIVDCQKVLPTHIKANYHEWRKVTKDCGKTTGAALTFGADKAWLGSNRQAAGNGSLMRTAVLGAALCDVPDLARNKAVIIESAITHMDPRCILACVVYNAMIARAVVCTAPVDEEVPEWTWKSFSDKIGSAAYTNLNPAAKLLGIWSRTNGWPITQEEIDEAEKLVLDALRRGCQDDPELYPDKSGHLGGKGGIGYVLTALTLAMWELKHAPSFEAGMIDVVNRGGDADTNGAIVGALLAAKFGLPRIPQRWVDAVLSAHPEGPLGEAPWLVKTMLTYGDEISLK